MGRHAQAEARAEVARQVRVKQADMAAAKAFIAARPQGTAQGVVGDWLRSLDLEPPAEIVLAGPQLGALLAQAADYMSKELAGYEALWDLVNVGVHRVADHHVVEVVPRLRWRSSPLGQSGQSGDWQFPELTYSYPAKFIRSRLPHRDGALTDGDLFLASISDAHLHPGVASALRQASACFRSDLPTPCAAMLGAAMEGAWGEVAKALVFRLGEGGKVKKVRQEIGKTCPSIARVIEVTRELLADRALAAPVLFEAGISQADVDHAVRWSHEVRESRNVLHWEVSTSVPNSYDKVALLMMGATRTFGTLAKLCRSAGNDRNGAPLDRDR